MSKDDKEAILQLVGGGAVTAESELGRLSSYLTDFFEPQIEQYGLSRTVDIAIRVMENHRKANEARQLGGTITGDLSASTNLIAQSALTADLTVSTINIDLDAVCHRDDERSAGELDGSELNGSVHIQETPHGFGDFIQKVEAARSHKDIVIDDRNGGRKSVDDPVRFRRK